MTGAATIAPVSAMARGLAVDLSALQAAGQPDDHDLQPAPGRRQRPARDRRQATQSLGRHGGVSFFMLFAYGNLTRQSFLNLHRVLDPAAAGAAPNARASFSLVSGPLSDAMTRGVTMEISLLVLVVVAFSLAARELSQPDWDLEWLITLPVSIRTQLWCRVLERALANPVGIVTLWPAGTLIAWISGYRWSVALLGALAVLPLLLLAAVARTLVDTGLRLSLAPSRLRNLQAVLSVASILILYSVLSLGFALPTRIHPRLGCADFPPGGAGLRSDSWCGPSMRPARRRNWDSGRC